MAQLVGIIRRVWLMNLTVKQEQRTVNHHQVDVHWPMRQASDRTCPNSLHHFKEIHMPAKRSESDSERF